MIKAHSKAERAEIVRIVTAWRNGSPSEMTAARAMYAIAKLLEIDPPAAVGGRTSGLRAEPVDVKVKP